MKPLIVWRIKEVDGKVRQHVMGATGNDYALCGYTLDGDPQVTESQTVISGRLTCPQCIEVILECHQLVKNYGLPKAKI